MVIRWNDKCGTYHVLYEHIPWIQILLQSYLIHNLELMNRTSCYTIRFTKALRLLDPHEWRSLSQWALPFVEGISYQWDLWVVVCLDIQYLLHFFVFVESYSDSRKSSRSCRWWSRTGEKPGTHAVTPWMLWLGAATLSLLLSF